MSSRPLPFAIPAALLLSLALAGNALAASLPMDRSAKVVAQSGNIGSSDCYAGFADASALVTNVTGGNTNTSSAYTCRLFGATFANPYSSSRSVKVVVSGGYELLTSCLKNSATSAGTGSIRGAAALTLAILKGTASSTTIAASRSIGSLSSVCPESSTGAVNNPRSSFPSSVCIVFTAAGGTSYTPRVEAAGSASRAMSNLSIASSSSGKARAYNLVGSYTLGATSCP